MARGVLRLVEDDDGVVERAAAHERQRSDLNHARLHVFLKLQGRDHVLEGIVERLQVRVDLVLHVAGKKTELLARLHCRTREDDFAAELVLQRIHGERDGYVGLAGSGGAEGERQVILGEAADHACLVGVARRDGLAVLTVDDHALGIDLHGGIAPDDIDYRILGQLIVFRGIILDLMYLLLELGSLGILAYHLYHVASRRHAQFREEVAD